MIRFADPAVLALLVPPAVAWWWSRRRGHPSRVRLGFSDTAVLDAVARTARTRVPRLLGVARLVGVVLAVAALARPQLGTVEERVTQEGIDIVIALDISRSMEAEDFQPSNRLDVAKAVIRKFAEGRNGDRLGLVIFAGKALTKCPLVLGPEIVAGLVDEVDFGEVEDGTAIGSAIATSLNRLKSGQGKSRVLVLVTDGVNNRGEIDPMTATRLARPLGVKIYTIGVGTQGLALFPMRDALGQVRHVQRPVEIDEQLLEQIAGETGGRYFRATDSEALAKIFGEIDALERSPAQIDRITRYRELFPLLLVPGLVLVVLAEVLSRTLFRVIP
ncbi:MAG: VWA domain-containing protein [Deltaproteobacteria bacterium]|nr:VWA domain-containing protein [Deltaproteobacteria bacterium]